MTPGAGAFPSAALLAAIRNGALAMAAPQARRLAEVVARHETPTAHARGEGLAVAPEPSVHGALVAAALCGAVDTAEAVRATQALDIVWTGPSSAEVPVRLTREVLLEVIGGSTSSLIIVSYAAYKVPDIVGALAEAASRGVDVRLVLESAAGSGGRLSLDAAGAFRELAGSVRFYEWSADRRTSDGGLKGAMHAKAAIADEQVAFVTSANLTGSAIEANMELGLLVRGGTVPRRLSRHFGALIAAAHVVEIRG
jgi:cardiolipin synthase